MALAVNVVVASIQTKQTSYFGNFKKATQMATNQET